MTQETHKTRESEATTPPTPDSPEFIAGRVEHFSDLSIRRLLENKENVQGLVEIVAPALAAQMDFNQLVEARRHFLPESLRAREADVVCRVPFQSEGRTEALLIYILVEHQSTVDKLMRLRVLSYMVRIWEFHCESWVRDKVPRREWQLPPILPIVFYTGEQRWREPLTLASLFDMPAALSRFVPRFDSLFLGVKSTDVGVLTAGDNPFGWLLTVLQKEGAAKLALSQALAVALSHLETLEGVGAFQMRELVWYFVSLILHRRPRAEHDELISLVDRHVPGMEVKPMAETMAEFLIERGIQQGKAEGLEQGMERGARENAIQNILAILNTRFPHSDAQLLAEALALIESIERLTQLLRVAVQTPSFDEFRQALNT